METEELKVHVTAMLGESPAAGVCRQLVDQLAALQDDRGRMLTYTSMQKMIHRNKIDHPLISAVNFLTSSKYAILEAHGQFVDDDGEEFELSDIDFQRLLLIGELIHPRTGEQVHRPRDKVTPVFTLRGNREVTHSE